VTSVRRREKKSASARAEVKFAAVVACFVEDRSVGVGQGYRLIESMI